MKKFVALCSALILMLSLAVPTTAFAKESADTNEAVETVREYINALGDQDWEGYVNLLPAAQQEDMNLFLADESNRDNYVGVFNIEDAKLVDARSVSSDYCVYSTEYKEKYGSEIQSYVVEVQLKTKEDTMFSCDGITYYLATLVKENGEWKIIEIPQADVRMIQEAYPVLEKDAKTAIENLELRYAGIWKTTDGEVYNVETATSEMLKSKGISPNNATVKQIENIKQSNSLCSREDQFARPDPILVWMASGRYSLSVDFYEYCKTVLYLEWGVNDLHTGAPHPMAALEAGALCVKNRAWYNYHHKEIWTHGCAVANDRDGHYLPGSQYQNPSSTQAINNVGGILIVDSNGNVMNTYFMAGNKNGNGYHGGICYQNGSVYLGNLGYSWENILHYYFDYASNVCPGGPCGFYHYY